jgi:peptidoglycan L-alanyl-D-glutamate endopeptidase CwlK
MTNNNQFHFSQSSLSKLITVDSKLQIPAVKVLEISPTDFAITEGLRTKERQLQLYKQGKSKTLNSKHLEGKAIDICPCINGKLDYAAESDLFFILGLFYLKAKELNEKYEITGGSEGLNIKLRFGAFWDYKSIRENKEKGFVDACHVELMLYYPF